MTKAGPGGADDAAAWIAEALARTDKYGGLCAETIDRFARRAAAAQPRRTQALQWAKRKLHESFGAFLESGGLDRALGLSAGLPAGDAGELRRACARVLDCHASTAERAPVAAEFYAAVFGATGVPGSVADLACGLNPFAWPWMGLSPACRYVAIDLDARIKTCLDRLWAAAGLPGEARCGDLLGSAPVPEAEVTLLLKTLPSLERQEPGAGERLLGRLAGRKVVVSFPTRSLGGRDKGMARTYAGTWEPVFGRLGFSVTRFEIGTELAYVLKP